MQNQNAERATQFYSKYPEVPLVVVSKQLPTTTDIEPVYLDYEIVETMTPDRTDIALLPIVQDVALSVVRFSAWTVFSVVRFSFLAALWIVSSVVDSVVRRKPDTERRTSSHGNVYVNVNVTGGSGNVYVNVNVKK